MFSLKADFFHCGIHASSGEGWHFAKIATPYTKVQYIQGAGFEKVKTYTLSVTKPISILSGSQSATAFLYLITIRLSMLEKEYEQRCTFSLLQSKAQS